VHIKLSVLFQFFHETRPKFFEVFEIYIGYLPIQKLRLLGSCDGVYFGSRRVLLQILFRRFEVELWRVFTMAWRRTEVLVVVLLSLIQVCESLRYKERKHLHRISVFGVSVWAAVLWWGSQLTHNAHMHCALFEASTCLLPGTIFVNLSFKVFHKRRLVFGFSSYVSR
jgi:hypothetical protein